jgi:hypothetical protein
VITEIPLMNKKTLKLINPKRNKKSPVIKIKAQVKIKKNIKNIKNQNQNQNIKSIDKSLRKSIKSIKIKNPNIKSKKIKVNHLKITLMMKISYLLSRYKKEI